MFKIKSKLYPKEKALIIGAIFGFVINHIFGLDNAVPIGMLLFLAINDRKERKNLSK